MTDAQETVANSDTKAEPLWQYKYRYNSTKESVAIPFSEILAMANAGKIGRLTPVKMVDWADFRYAQDVPYLLDAIRPVAWLRFWMYVRLPVGALFVCLAALDGGMVSMAINLAFAAWLIVISVGLHKRRLWAWKQNLCIVFGEPVLWVMNRYQPQEGGATTIGNVIGSLIGLAVLWAAWTWPNYIYFNKRKELFKSEKRVSH